MLLWKRQLLLKQILFYLTLMQRVIRAIQVEMRFFECLKRFLTNTEAIMVITQLFQEWKNFWMMKVILNHSKKNMQNWLMNLG